jgi:hypothetical protein
MVGKQKSHMGMERMPSRLLFVGAIFGGMAKRALNADSKFERWNARQRGSERPDQIVCISRGTMLFMRLNSVSPVVDLTTRVHGGQMA